MVKATKTFRVFVSSTFSDLKEERNALQKHVFPKLRELCMEHGFRFQAIDLRWGVSEEAALDQQTMKICLEEIERSQRVSPKPNFIVLLGDRYGWIPLPCEIPADEFEEIKSVVTDEDDRKFLFWEGDILDDEQLKKREGWYCRDDNAVPPVYCLKPRLVDYGEDASDDEIIDAKDKEAKDWEEKESRLKCILFKAIEDLCWEGDDPRRSKYESSATEQEIISGAVNIPEGVPDAKEHVFCYFRSIHNLPKNRDFADLDAYGEFDLESDMKIKNLKKQLKKILPDNHIKEYTAEWIKKGVRHAYLDDLCNDVYISLACIIMKQIRAYEEIDPLDREIIAHKEFGKDRCKFFVGREENLDKIRNYIKTTDAKPFVVYGDSGSGKSALMAKVIEYIFPNFYDKKDLYDEGVVVRFIGATPESSDLRSLLESICRQITEIYDEDDANIPSEYNELVQDFKDRLNFASSEKPLFIFLDALDQLSDIGNAHDLIWLTEELPENVKIILSTLTGPFQDWINNNIISNENRNELYQLKTIEGKAILNLWFDAFGRKLTEEQEKEVISKFDENGLPLYLKIAFEEARRWKSYSFVPELRSDVFGIIKQMFERLSQPKKHGQVFFSHSLGFLSAAKNGLTEDEMLDILAIDKKVLNLTKKFHNPPEDKLPVALWSRLYFDLEPYLTMKKADDTYLLVFYHRQLEEAAWDEYLKGDMKKSRHKLLAKYFYRQDSFFDKEGKRVYNIRKVSELPYQEIYGECWKQLENSLTDLNFVQVKSEVGMTYDLIKDYNVALKLHPDAKRKSDLEHENRVDEYFEDLIAFSERKIENLDTVAPNISNGEESKKIELDPNNSEPLVVLKAFYQFVNSQALKNQENKVRKYAVSMLGRIGSRRTHNRLTEALQPLIEATRDEDEGVREAAAEAIYCIGFNEEAVEPLINNLKSEDWFARREAALDLGTIRDRRAVKPLIDLLKVESDKDDRFRYAAARSLGEIRDRVALQTLIDALTDRDPKVRLESANALEKMEWKPVSDIETFQYFFAKQDADKLVMMGEQAVIPLIQVLNGYADDNLHGNFKYFSLEIMVDVIDILRQIGDERAVEPLIRLLNMRPWMVIEALKEFDNKNFLDENQKEILKIKIEEREKFKKLYGI